MKIVALAGGTALVTLFIGIGILMSLRRQRRLVPT